MGTTRRQGLGELLVVCTIRKRFLGAQNFPPAKSLEFAALYPPDSAVQETFSPGRSKQMCVLPVANEYDMESHFNLL